MGEGENLLDSKCFCCNIRGNAAKMENGVTYQKIMAISKMSEHYANDAKMSVKGNKVLPTVF